MTVEKVLVRFPLINFHLVPFERKTVKLTEKEIIAPFDNDKIRTKYPSRTMFLLEIENQSYNKLLQRAERVITALRLFEQGFIGFDEPIWSDEIQVFTGAEITFLRDLKEITKMVNFFPDYSLEQNQIVDVQRFLSKVDHTVMDSNLKVALRHFNQATATRFRYERLVKLVMALDTLFTSKHLPIRVAILLGKDETERKNIHKIVEDAWKFRCNIVHGSAQNVPFSFQIDVLENVVRDSIKALIALKQDDCYKGKGGRHLLLSDLDKCIFDSKLEKSIQEKVKTFYLH